MTRKLAETHRAVLVAGYREGHFLDDAADAPFEIVALSRSPGPLARASAAIRLRRWPLAQPSGVLLSMGNMGHPTAYWGTRGLPHIRRVYRISTRIARGNGTRSRFRRLWMEVLVRDAALTILVGDSNAAAPPFTRALEQGRAAIIANGIDRQAAREQARAPVPHAWLEEDVPVVLGIGRLRPQKNFERLVEAVAQARRFRRMRLILLGGGGEAEKRRLTDLAIGLGFADDLLLAGETNNVFAWLSRASVFALPSLWEGSSMALLEALAVGVPVVAARQAGDAAQILGEGRYGLLADGHDASALSHGILRQLSADAVPPGHRVDDYSPPLGRYADVLDQVIG